jgi:hypothetical protein
MSWVQSASEATPQSERRYPVSPCSGVISATEGDQITGFGQDPSSGSDGGQGSLWISGLYRAHSDVFRLRYSPSARSRAVLMCSCEVRVTSEECARTWSVICDRWRSTADFEVPNRPAMSRTDPPLSMMARSMALRFRIFRHLVTRAFSWELSSERYRSAQ